MVLNYNYGVGSILFCYEDWVGKVYELGRNLDIGMCEILLFFFK